MSFSSSWKGHKKALLYVYWAIYMTTKARSEINPMRINKCINSKS